MSSNDWQYAPRSQDMEEIISQPPSWLTLYGTLFLIATVLGLVTLSYFYVYPDTVSGDLTLTTVDPPRPLRVPQDFPIDQLLVKNQDSVRANQVLMVSKSLATFNDVFELSERMLAQPDLSDDGLANFYIPPDWNLGEIQEAAYELQEKQEIFKNLKERKLDGLTTRELESRIRQRERFIREERSKQSRSEDELRRGRRILEREEQLRADGLDNRTALNRARLRVERAEDDLNASRSEVRAASFDIELMRNQIETYRGGLPSTILQAAEDLRTAYDGLKAALATWESNFTIVSPVKGLLLLERDIRQGGTLLRGDQIGLVLPANPGGIVGRIDLPNKGSGEVKEGQRVLVQFDSYPHLEYGSVEGRVTAVGQLVRGGIKTVEVAFPQQLITTTGRQLDAGPLMEGEAYIITDAKSLLKRFFQRS